MNERIKQLWEEAAKTTQSDSWEEQTKFMERFAELIVQECMEEVMTYQHHRNPTIPFIVEDIKKHFGVG
jgi:hypothetical protein